MPADDSALKYRALTEISEAFLGSRDCDALFRSLWDSLRKLIRFDFLLLMLIDEAQPQPSHRNHGRRPAAR